MGWESNGLHVSLSDDDHSQYVLLAGRSGGQTVYGDTAANGDITIHGTSNATKTTSYVLLQPTGGNVGIGTSAPASLLHANLADAGTNAVATVLTVGHNSSGTPTTSFGSRILLQLKSSTTADQDAAAIDFQWSDAAHASRSSYISLSTVNSGTLAEKVRIIANGNVLIGTSQTPSYSLHVARTAANANIAAISTTSGQASLFLNGYYNETVTGYGIGRAGSYIGLQNSDATNGNYTFVSFKDSAGSDIAGIVAVNSDHTNHAGYFGFLVRPASGSLTRAMTIRETAVVKISGTGSVERSTTEGTNHLDIFNGTAPVGTLANGVSLYSASGKLWAMDSAGNATQLTP